jgi:hypothetical protein
MSISTKKVLYMHSTPFQLKYQLKITISEQSIIAPDIENCFAEKQKLH